MNRNEKTSEHIVYNFPDVCNRENSHDSSRVTSVSSVSVRGRRGPAPSGPGGDIQKRIDLRSLANFLLGPGQSAGDGMVYFIPQFDPDYPEYHVFKDYFRNPVSGDRGSSIKFLQRLRRWPKERAIGYLMCFAEQQDAYRVTEHEVLSW